MQVSLKENTNAKMTLSKTGLKLLLFKKQIDLSIVKLVNNGINKEDMLAKFKLEFKKATSTSGNISPIIITKDKNMNKSTFIAEAKEIFKELPSNIKH